MPNPADSAVLETSLLFHRVGLESVEHLLEHCTRQIIPAGQILVGPRVGGGFVYIVLAGELRVYANGRELPAQSILGAGDCAGLVPMLDGQLPSPLVIAARETQVLAIPHETLWSMVDLSHGIARNLLAILGKRLARDNPALVMVQSAGLEFEPATSVDALTGLHNRHWLLENFPRAIQRCKHDGSPLCLVLADVDHFTAFNERHGYLVGDALLRRIAGRLAASLRSQDLIARHGGEEFAVLLPQANSNAGLEVAERLRQAIAEIRLNRAGQTLEEGITLSCGIAPLRLGDTLETLVTAARVALQQAKTAGRNRIELAVEP